MEKATRKHLAKVAWEAAQTPFHGQIEGKESNLEPIIRFFPKWTPREADGLWCAAFVYYCCREAGFEIPIRPDECKTCHLAGCIAWEEFAAGDPRITYHQSSEGFVPEAGDIVLYDRVFENREHDHIGIVMKNRGDTILAAEGNIDNRSGIVKRPKDEHIRGYIRLPDGYGYQRSMTDDQKTGPSFRNSGQSDEGDHVSRSIVSQWYEKKKNVEEMRGWNPALKAWEREVIGHFPAGARLLDIGCGLGREAFPLSDSGFDVVGIDISREVISQVRRLAEEKGYDIPFMACDGKKLPFPDDSFDVVLIWAQTFGLLYGEEYRRDYLLECRRVLKTGGLLSFSAHDYEYLKAQYPHCLDGRKFYPYAGADVYWEAFEVSELTQYARQTGFDVILCGKGRIYKPEDGTILHCLCRKQ